MGRGRITAEPLSAEFIQASFRVRQDGRITRSSTGEVATFRGPHDQLLVRVYIGGKIRRRRITAGRIAWALATGSWPKGVVRCRNGIDDDLRAENLILTRRGPRPFDQASGGKVSLIERQARATTLLRTLQHEHSAYGWFDPLELLAEVKETMIDER
jgi:hypothetical protein